MTKTELDKRAREILDSPVLRSIRNNMVLATVDDLAGIFGIPLPGVHSRFGTDSQYTIEVIEKIQIGYKLRFPNGRTVEMQWEENSEENTNDSKKDL